jgi:hypothetical protein
MLIDGLGLRLLMAEKVAVAILKATTETCYIYQYTIYSYTNVYI